MSKIIIIGAGPAGLAAAAAALASGAQIDIIDDNHASGGQIWRGGADHQKDTRATKLWQQLSQSTQVQFHFGAKVVHATKRDDTYQIVVEKQANNQTQIFSANKMILCTGARELLLPFPGWTLNGVTGAGGLQALAKAAYPVAGKRIIVAGSGPLLFAVAASLIERGAHVTHVIEQAKFGQLSRFALGLIATPSKITQAYQLMRTMHKTLETRYHANSYVVSAHASTDESAKKETTKEASNDTIKENTLACVRVSIQGEVQDIPCDMLACGYGLMPNTELATVLGCAILDDKTYPKVQVNEAQETSLHGVYCAGEGTGIGGVDLALAEGTIAGLAASGQSISSKYKAQRHKWRGFAQRLHQAFGLRDELKHLCQADTIVCRCEDVTYGQLEQHSDWRDAKLHTRCGMGACQGRICGNANRFLFSWEKDSGRLPMTSMKIASLMIACENDTK
ncbi:NAD(P)/FAD-dependent oxidoreductase [Undibacterium baiyunense]|nr:FAD/NAD(P)-binding oxidoreductase [Undibacterium baiyunense]